MDMVWKDRRHNQKSTVVATVTGIGGREGVRSDENDIHGWVWRVATLCGTVWGGTLLDYDEVFGVGDFFACHGKGDNKESMKKINSGGR